MTVPPAPPLPARAVWTRVHGYPTYARVQGDGPPLVLFPGLGCRADYYRDLQAQLARAHTVWVYEPIGVGRAHAPWNELFTIERVTDHFAQWLCTRDFGPVPILAHSLGGEVAIDLAVRYFELASHLMLMAPTGVPEVPSLSRQMLGLARDGLREKPRFVLEGISGYLRSSPWRVYQLALDQKRHDTGPRLPHVRQPTLVLAGNRDPVVSPYLAGSLAKEMPHAQFEVLYGGTHGLQDSKPLEVTREVLRFLARG